MPQYPQIVLFSCVRPSDLTNQRFRLARRTAGGFEVNPQPLNPEPRTCERILKKIQIAFKKLLQKPI